MCWGRAGYKREGEHLAIASLQPATRCTQTGCKSPLGLLRPSLLAGWNRPLFPHGFCFSGAQIFYFPPPESHLCSACLCASSPLRSHNPQGYSFLVGTSSIPQFLTVMTLFEPFNSGGSMISLFSDLPVRTHSSTCWDHPSLGRWHKKQRSQPHRKQSLHSISTT